ncbi:L-rhamnose mutarotase [Sphingobacterium sp. LRF_L2]|uniref:L-rhamnose mutarotase n=1 Tax=Sphingobacterium sp. LRF_L2 TaxID=3369421 RepID=UPI003F60B007
MRRFALGLDLIDDEALIAEYDAYHRDVWPEIRDSIRDAGVANMEIYRFANRLFMVMEVNESFTFEEKADMDASNAKVQEWEQLMWKYQQAIPGAKKGEKWVLMNKIFAL